MKKQVTHINCPKEWESENDWDSHRPLLFACLYNTTGIVNEFGCGYGSTKLINDFCDEYKRDFYSYDTNKEWVEKMNHITILVDDYMKDLRTSVNIDVLFIDCAPAEIRKELISKFSKSAKIIVAHDTEPGAEYVYGMSKILNSFKYRLDYQPKGKPHTTAVSNFIDVTKWIS